MSHAEITMVQEGIHNPSDARHYMRLRPAKRHVRVLYKGQVLAESAKAVRLLEVGKDLYDQLFYIPEGDVKARLQRNDTKTHCPIKGDAAYFDLIDESGTVVQEKIAWTYPEPVDFAQGLKGLMAFYPEHVVVEESPLS